MSEIRQHGRDLIEAARVERTPSARDRERILAALMAGAAVTTAATSAVAAPPLLAKLLGGGGKWWLLGGLCTVVAGGGYVASSQVQSSSELRPVPALAATAGVVAGPTSAAEPAPPASPGLAVDVGSPAPTPAARAPSVKRESTAPDLELELSALHAAHAAYRSGRAEQAISLIAQHRSRYPHSQLGTERSTLEVLALCRVGRQQQARQLAERLQSSARGSAALSGLEGSCVAPSAK